MIEQVITHAWGRAANPGNGAMRQRLIDASTDVCVTLNGIRHGAAFQTFRPMADMALSFADFHAAGVGVYVMSWARPDEVHARAACAVLRELYWGLGLKGIVLDLEGPWARGFPKGHRPRTAALREAERRRIAEIYRDELQGIPIIITDVVYSTDGVIRPWHGIACEFWIQCHAWPKNRGRVTGPTRLPQKAHERHSHRPMKLVFGGAAYTTSQSGPQSRRSLIEHAASVVALGGTAIPYWTTPQFKTRIYRDVLAEIKAQALASQVAA
ncbi:MAG: hypothetical protein ACPGVG_10245 [Mycobacterium sp.]